MHKYFARRPWNVFNELISHYTSRSDIVLDPFCGGGVTVVESLKLGRRAIGVDVNPLATYVTEMQCRFLNIGSFQEALLTLRKRVEVEIVRLYRTSCTRCKSDAVAEWVQWDEVTGQMTRIKFACPKCNYVGEKSPSAYDRWLARDIDRKFNSYITSNELWYPNTRIPNGDKTNGLIGKDVRFFFELFTKRNLLALSLLLKEIDRIQDEGRRDFLRLAFSSSLKWASRQSHLRGKIVEGWAMHAYWLYPKSLEINVWKTFERRAQAVVRGKKYSNEHLGEFAKLTDNFNDLVDGKASCLILNRSSTDLPLPDNSIDAIITDPPYGGNVNYAELADYWLVWINDGKIVDKIGEVIINRTQRKTLDDYAALLSAIMAECYRVLKPERYLVSTFNSRDIRVVASFIGAAAKAGFTLHPNGLLYQSPIRSYTTTFHAMQIGAFVGDFVFTFIKSLKTQQDIPRQKLRIDGLKQSLAELVEDSVDKEITESRLREEAYRILIPFLVVNARANPGDCKEATDFFEAKFRERDEHFRKMRLEITERRKRKFLRQR